MATNQNYVIDPEEVARFEELMQEIKERVQEAYEIIPRGSITQARAKSYWYGHIVTAIDKDNDFLGGSMTMMCDTLDELKAHARGEDDEEEPEEPEAN